MPECMGCFDYMDDYCYFDCPYSYECEDQKRYGYDNYYGDGYYNDYWD